MSTGLARAREDLFAAHLLASTQFAAQAIGLAHHGALASAGAALEALDRVPPSEPAALIAAFLRQVVRERGLDAEAGRRLRAVHNRAVIAGEDSGGADGGDGDDDPVPREEATEAIADARAVIEAVDDWLTHSEFVMIARAAVRPAARHRR